jgi:hypothetical protein
MMTNFKASLDLQKCIHRTIYVMMSIGSKTPSLSLNFRGESDTEPEVLTFAWTYKL